MRTLDPVLVLLLCLAIGGCSSLQTIEADAVYTHGKLYTVDNTNPWAEALAIKDGKLIAVGSNEEIEAIAGSNTEVVDLAGKFVMPGIQDAHIHTQMAAEFALQLNMDPHQPWTDIAQAISNYATEHSDKSWVFGGMLPWLTATIGEFKDVPAHKSVLDKLVPDRPAAFWDIGGHAILANSRALELAGIDRNTANPTGGTIERDGNGEPTGVLRELAANLVTEAMDALPVEAYESGIKQAIGKLNALGITSINEVWAYPVALQALKTLDTSNELEMRVTAAIAHPVEFVTPDAKKAAEEVITDRETYRGRRLKPDYVKFVLDGSAGGQTLAMVDPYEGTDFRGDMRNDEATVMREVSRLHALGIGSVLHAVGDRAVRVALNAVEQAIKAHGNNGVRHVIAHTVFVNPQDLDRFAELGVIAEFSPYFWWPGDGLDVIEKDIGEKRAAWGFPVKQLLDSGVPLAAGSDWPVVFDPNPFPAIEAMVTREVPGGSDDSFGKEHAISLAQTLEIFTQGGAYEHYQEETTGSLATGKYADFIVLDRNPFEIDKRLIHKTRVMTTVLEGAVVFQR